MSEELQEVIDSNPEWYKDLLYRDVKIFIRDNINSASRSFVAIGYYLKYVRDNQLYKEDGYTGISEFAKAEFGISAAQASKFMSINDRFSKDGNSPVLLDQFKDFSSSKLSEMLYLTDEQLEQVTITTTVAEIREIKEPAKEVSFSTSKTEPEISDSEKWLIRCEVLKEMCDCICKMMSYILEKNDYGMDTIKSLSRKDQEFSFGFGGENGYSKYMARCKSDKYYVETFDETAKWIYEAGEVDQHIWNFNGREWHNNHRKSEEVKALTIDDLELSVNTYNCLKRANIDTIEQLCNLTEDKVIAIRNISRKCLDEIKQKLSEIGREFKPDDIHEIVNDEPETVDNEPEFENVVDESVIATSASVIEEPESVTVTVEADIILTEPEEVKQGTNYSLNAVYTILQKAKADYEEVVKVVGAPKALMEKRLIIRDALLDFYQELRGRETAWYISPQPELPILKNNDQRQEWLKNYRDWGIWYRDDNINVTYYRFTFTDGSCIIVDEYISWDIYNRKERTSAYYHIVGKVFNSQGDKSRYSHYDSSTTELIEHLKQVQKKGA